MPARTEEQALRALLPDTLYPRIPDIIKGTTKLAVLMQSIASRLRLARHVLAVPAIRHRRGTAFITAAKVRPGAPPEDLILRILVSTCAGVDGVVLPDESSDANQLIEGPRGWVRTRFTCPRRSSRTSIRHLSAGAGPRRRPSRRGLLEAGPRRLRLRGNMTRSPSTCPLLRVLPLTSVTGISCSAFSSTKRERSARAANVPAT